MQELVILKNDETVCSSISVAERFNKRHDHVLRDIENLLEGIPKNEETYFKKSSYVNEQNKQRYPMYYMNRDGFSLLVMGFTGKKALEWKLQYIRAFNEMERLLKERSAQTWIETRQQGKLTRKSETDVIQKLVEYANEQGSEHSDKLYVTYSKLANKMAGIDKRDTASVMQLNNLSLIENIILNCIQLGMAMDKPYKVIYQDCKRRLETFKDIAYLETA